MRIALATLIVVLFACQAEARLFGRRNRNTNNYTYYNTGYTTYTDSWGGDPQSVAAAKAEAAASGLVKGHLGGGYGGANAEGVGFSTYSAQHALNNCCFTGQRPLAGSAVYRGADGWYAVKIYW